MKPGRERSGDSFLGWLSHYERMKRWEVRAKQVAETDFMTQTPDTIDFALAYFIWAHSLRDWLIEAGSIESSALDGLLNGRREWLLCRDLANKSRHYNLQKKPTDKDFIISYQIDLNAILSGATRQVIGGVYHDGRYYEFSECIGVISEMWEAVLNQLGLERGNP